MLTGFILAAPYGITAVAAVHLSYNLVYAYIRLALANRFIGTSMRDALRAMRPALTISAGIALFGLPVRFLIPTGQLALAAIILAGIAGAGLGLLASGRGPVDELRELAGDLGSRRR